MKPLKTQVEKKKKPTGELKKVTIKHSVGSDGSTRTEYPKRIGAKGATSQLTKTTKVVKKKKN